MQPIQSVLLEFDGILADTEAHKRRSVLDLFREDGVILSDTDYDELCGGLSVGEGVRAVAAVHRPAADETALDLLALRAEREYASALAKGVVLVEGARTAIQRLAEDARVGVVSRLRRRSVETLLEMAALDDVVCLVVGAEDVFPHKPSPAPYLKAIERMRRVSGPPGKAIVALESALSGIRSARAAGALCVAVGSLPAHVAMEADAFLSSLAGQDAASLARLLRLPHTPSELG
jgi:beta-phosphoglucomutase-like phosphatase (HAD superfamily)